MNKVAEKVVSVIERKIGDAGLLDTEAWIAVLRPTGARIQVEDWVAEAFVRSIPKGLQANPGQLQRMVEGLSLTQLEAARVTFRIKVNGTGTTALWPVRPVLEAFFVHHFPRRLRNKDSEDYVVRITEIVIEESLNKEGPLNKEG